MSAPPSASRRVLVAAKGASLIDVVLKWPLLLVDDVQYGMYIPALIALGAGYYIGGVPLQGQSMQTYAMAYGAAGLGYYAGLMVSQRGAPDLDRA